MSDNIVTTVHPWHAIKEVVFVLQFEHELTEQQIRPLKRLHGRLESDLPKIEEVNALNVEIKDNKLVQPTGPIQQIAGLRLSHFKEDGEQDWLVRVERNFIAVSCFDYSRWSSVWPLARKYLDTFAREIIGPSFRVKAAILQYLDRFIFHGDQEEYSGGHIFDPDNTYLPPHVFSVGPFWHVHQGWFDQWSEHSQVLNRLHVDVADSDGEHQTTVDHQGAMQFHSPIPNPRTLFGDSGADDALIDEGMNQLHDANKTVLRRLLNVEMRRRISLDEE